MEKALNVDIRQFYREDLGVHSEELLDKLEAVSQAVTLQKGEILNKKGERQTMLPLRGTPDHAAVFDRRHDALCYLG